MLSKERKVCTDSVTRVKGWIKIHSTKELSLTRDPDNLRGCLSMSVHHVIDSAVPSPPKERLSLSILVRSSSRFDCPHPSSSCFPANSQIFCFRLVVTILSSVQVQSPHQHIFLCSAPIDRYACILEYSRSMYFAFQLETQL